MLLYVYPVVCVKVIQTFNAHIMGHISNNFVGIILLVRTQGCGKPQITDKQKVDTHVFYLCNHFNIKRLALLGYHKVQKNI